MKISIIGAGGIGCVAAAYLHKAGQDVTLVGRQNQVDDISSKGLLVKSSEGEENYKIKSRTLNLHMSDLVIFTTKTQDLEEAYQQNNEYLDNSCVLTSQNGVQADSILGVHFEREKRFSSIVMFGATYVKPGEVIHTFQGNWIIGKPYITIDPMTHKISDVLGTAFPVVVSDNIIGMKYVKLFINFNNCLCGLTGKSMQEVFSDIDMCRLSVRLLKEGLDIVQMANVELVSLPEYSVERLKGLVSMPEDEAAGILQKVLTTLSDEPVYGSILQSIMRKKTSEIDFINGEVVHMARSMQKFAPLNDKVLDMVHEVENTGKFMGINELKEEFIL